MNDKYGTDIYTLYIIYFYTSPFVEYMAGAHGGILYFL